MDGLVVSAAFGMGLLLVYDAMVRPAAEREVGARLRRAAPAVAAGAAGAALCFVATGWPVAAAAGGAVGASAPAALLRSRGERLRLERREAIAEISTRLRDSIRAGIGLADALAQVAERAPAAVREDLRLLVAQAQVSGLPDAARSFADRLRDPAADLLASALATAEELGSRNLSDVLDSLADAAAGQAAAVREARARQVRSRLSARVVAAVPVLLVLAIRRTNPAYLEPFEDPAGQTVLAFALVLIWTGYQAMRRAARIEEVSR